MSLTKETKGINSQSVDALINITAGPLDPNAIINATLTSSASESFEIGQLFTLTTVQSGVQKFTKVTDASTITVGSNLLVGLDKLAQTASEAIMAGAMQRSFIGTKLTPADLPPGVYNGGNIIIESEVN